jgi:hypothetical protein
MAGGHCIPQRELPNYVLLPSITEVITKRMRTAHKNARRRYEMNTEVWFKNIKKE